MKLTIQKSVFVKALGHACGVVERKTTIPVLNHVLFKTKEGKLEITATDNDLALVETIDAFIETQGSAVVPTQTLYDLVKKFPDNAVISLDLNDANGQLQIVCGRAHISLACLAESAFPHITQIPVDFRFTLSGSCLQSIFENVRYAIAAEDLRQNMNGVYLHFLEDKRVIRGVATDGHRLVHYDVPAPEGAEKIEGVIISKKAVAELLKLIEDNVDDMFSVGLSKGRIEFSSASCLLSARLVEGRFPDYLRVLPQNLPSKISIIAKDLKDMVDRVATIAMDKTSGRVKVVKMTLSPGSLTLSAINQELGNAVEDLPIEYAGEPFEIGFNARYLMDALQYMDVEQISILFGDHDTATLIRPANDPLPVQAAIMPMRV